MSPRRKLLRDEGLVETIEAEDRDAHPDLLRRVRGKTVAVDLSIWIFEATSQRELAEIFTPAGQVAKVVFERACNFLRHGVVPVGVLDGVPPPEKLRRLGLLAAAGAGGGEFKKLGEVARKVLAALGLCAVAAPGEAEATCAALNARGLVDACATGDGDALLFGATTVFKTLKLYADNPELSRLERCESAWIGDALELDEDTRPRAEGASGASESNAEDENAARAPHRYPGDPGDPGDGSVMEGDAHGSLGVVADALVALATLAGGDYDVGADRVGPTLAARAAAAGGGGAAERAAAPAAFPGGRTGRAGAGAGAGRFRLERDPPSRKRRAPEPCPGHAHVRAPTRSCAFPDDAPAVLTQCTGCATCKHDGGGAAQEERVRGASRAGSPKASPASRVRTRCECSSTRGPRAVGGQGAPPARVTEGFAAARRAAGRVREASVAAAAAVAFCLAPSWRARAAGRARARQTDALVPPDPRATRPREAAPAFGGTVAGRAGRRAVRGGGDQKDGGRQGAAPWRFLLEVDAADPRERAVAARARERAREVRKANKVAEASRPSAGSDEPSSDFSDSASEGPGPAPSAADDDDRPQIEKDLAYFAAKPQTRAVRAEWCAPRPRAGGAVRARRLGDPGERRGGARRGVGEPPRRPQDARGGPAVHPGVRYAEEGRRGGAEFPRAHPRGAFVERQGARGVRDASRDSRGCPRGDPRRWRGRHAPGDAHGELVGVAGGGGDPAAQDGAAQDSGRRAFRGGRPGRRIARDGVSIDRGGRGAQPRPSRTPARAGRRPRARGPRPARRPGVPDEAREQAGIKAFLTPRRRRRRLRRRERPPRRWSTWWTRTTRRDGSSAKAKRTTETKKTNEEH